MLAMIITLALFADRKNGWQKVMLKERILVEKQVDPGSPILRFRGKGTIEASILEILSIIQDVKNHERWNGSSYDNRIVETISESSVVFYSANEAPWPLKDRDYVVQITTLFDHKNKMVTIEGHEVTNPIAPVIPSRVRMPMVRINWKLKKIPGKNRKATDALVSFQIDPGGIVPAWAVNLISKNYPFKTIRNIREECQRGHFDLEFMKKYKKYQDW